VEVVLRLEEVASGEKRPRRGRTAYVNVHRQ
jgi:hypothetical protein